MMNTVHKSHRMAPQMSMDITMEMELINAHSKLQSTEREAVAKTSQHDHVIFSWLLSLSQNAEMHFYFFEERQKNELRMQTVWDEGWSMRKKCRDTVLATRTWNIQHSFTQSVHSNEMLQDFWAVVPSARGSKWTVNSYITRGLEDRN